MKNDNRKRNGLLTASAIFYILFALDLIVNTALAHILNGGQSLIANAMMLGPFVVNVISLSISFSIATILLVIGCICAKVSKEK